MTQITYEYDLFDPIRIYLEKNGYTVKAELKDCDIVAIKDDEVIIIEMKKNLNLTLLSQAVDRQKISQSVYIAVEKPKKKSKAWNKYLLVLKKLELGLIYVNVKMSSIDIVFHPQKYNLKKDPKRKISLLKEFNNRSKNYNVGGMNGKKIMTAYKESSVFIAVLFLEYGAMSAKELKKYGTGEKTYSIIYKNYYGWFEKVEKGIYGLNNLGIEAVKMYSELKKYYIKKIEEIIKSEQTV